LTYLIDSCLEDVNLNLSNHSLARSEKSSNPELWYKIWEKHQKGKIRELKNKIEKVFRKHLKIKDVKMTKCRGTNDVRPQSVSKMESLCG